MQGDGLQCIVDVQLRWLSVHCSLMVVSWAVPLLLCLVLSRSPSSTYSSALGIRYVKAPVIATRPGPAPSTAGSMIPRRDILEFPCPRLRREGFPRR